jgi:hypothetical protein
LDAVCCTAHGQTLSLMIELGTASGVTSLYFGMAARARGIEFHTCARCHAARGPLRPLRALV